MELVRFRGRLTVGEGGGTMASKTVQHTPEFRRQMVGLSLDTGKDDGGLSSAEREELTRLRRESRRLKEERQILSKAAA